jgi:hypothetical protein
MTLARWFLALATLMFVTSVWFVVTAVQRPVPTASAPPFATTRQLMLGLVIPASTTIYESAGTVSTVAGTVDKAPQTDKEWEVVAAHAATLVEASELLVAEGRGIDDPVWIKAAADMGIGARRVIEAAQKRSVDDLLDKGGEIVAACDACHKKFVPGVR